MHFTKTTCCCEAAPSATRRRPSGSSFMQVKPFKKKKKGKKQNKKMLFDGSLKCPSCSCRARNQSHAQQQRPALQAQQTGETDECRRLLVRRHPAGHVPVCSRRCVNIYTYFILPVRKPPPVTDLCFNGSFLLLAGHGLWMFQYGVQRPVFDVLSREGTDLSPIMSAIYLFLTMIIVFQVRNGGATLGDCGGSSSRAIYPV